MRNYTKRPSACSTKPTRWNRPRWPRCGTRPSAQLPFDRLQKLLAAGSSDELAALAPQVGLDGQALAAPLAGLRDLWVYLDRFGIAEYCRFDLRIVRGLAYYTGVVFEIYDRRGVLTRAVAGGGRYDNLLQLVGGPPIAAVGVGMGDFVLWELLKDLGRVQGVPTRVDVYVVDAEEDLFPDVLRIVADLRRKGVAAEFSYKRQSLGKQLKSASQRDARMVIIVGGKYRENRIVEVKDMQTGQQREVPLADLLANPRQHVKG